MRRKDALIAVIGGVVGAVVTMAVDFIAPLGAQSGESAVFGTVTCHELNVVDKASDTKVRLSSVGVFVVDKESFVSMSGGQVILTNLSHGTGAKMHTDERGGAVLVFGKGGKGENPTRAAIHVDEYGNGTVSTWDKKGDRLATLK